MVGFDGNTITDATINEITEGLKTDELAAADSICTIESSVTALTGDLPNLNSDAGLSRLENTDLPEFAEAKPHGGTAGQTSFDCLAQVGHAYISDKQIGQFAAFGLDWVENRIRQARADANANVDNKLATVLASTSLNDTYNTLAAGDGSGGWADESNGRPLNDLVKARRSFAPGADMFVYGPGTEELLMKHPDVVAEFSNFSAGQVDETTLRNLIARKLGIPLENVVKFYKLYNSATRPGTVVPAWLFENGAWLGYKRDLIMVDPRNPEGGPRINNITEVEREASRRAHGIYHTRNVDILRPNVNLGVTFTNLTDDGS